MPPSRAQLGQDSFRQRFGTARVDPGPVLLAIQILRTVRKCHLSCTTDESFHAIGCGA
jgi:hypothetical protein